VIQQRLLAHAQISMLLASRHRDHSLCSCDIYWGASQGILVFGRDRVPRLIPFVGADRADRRTVERLQGHAAGSTVAVGLPLAAYVILRSHNVSSPSPGFRSIA